MFKKYDNPLTSLNIGQKVLIEDWLNKKGIKKYVINKDLSIYIYGAIDLLYFDPVNIPSFIKINNLTKLYFYYSCIFKEYDYPNLIKNMKI